MQETRAQSQTPGATMDVVRQAFDHLEASEHGAVSELCHDDFEFKWTGVGSRRHHHRGRNAFQHHLGDMDEAWDEIEVMCDRLTNGSDRVVAFYRLRGLAQDGSLAVSPHAAVVRVRDAQLWRWDSFQDAARSFDWLATESRLA